MPSTSAPRATAGAPARPTARSWHSGGRWCSACRRDRKSTRLNSSHLVISDADFCLKKKINDEGYATIDDLAPPLPTIKRLVDTTDLHPAERPAPDPRPAGAVLVAHSTSVTRVPMTS